MRNGGGNVGKYIDADNAIERLGAYLMTDAQIEYGGLASEDIEDWKPIATDILKGAPSIDIVRCKECRHSEESLVSCSVYCNEMDRAISENGFCHKGERKESE
jgi:hypothetical protein